MKKRLLACLLALALCIPAAGLAEILPEGLPISSEPIELTACVSQSPIQGDVNEMVILKEFAAASNVNVKFTNIPSTDRATQLSLMLASGEVPDILFKMSVSANDQAKYAAEDMFVAISDYPELTPNLNRWFEEYPSARDAVTVSDGKVYAAPYILAGYSIRMGNKYFFNTDVLQKLGYEKIPTTTDELLDYFRAAKALDYNENGEADEIPMTASSIDAVLTGLAGSFGLYNRGGSHTTVFVDDDGNLAYNWSSERYRDMLRFLNTMYEEKLLDQDIFTMDFAQLIAKASTGRALTYCMVNNSPVAGTQYEQYTLGMTEPFEGPKGHKFWGLYTLPSSGSGQFMITYKCAEKGEEYVKAALRWMDHWYSDEGIIAYFMGVEGVTYEKDEASPGGLKLTDYVLNNPDGINFEQVLAAYVPWAGGANPSVATNEFFKGGETWPAAVASADGLINYVPEITWTPFTRYYTVDESSEMSAINNELNNYYKEWRGYFITGQKDLDADWDAYVAGYEGMNLARYMEIYEGGMEAAGAK